MSWYDYVPGVSNVAGAFKGDAWQALTGPAGKIPALQKMGDSLTGEDTAKANEEAGRRLEQVGQQGYDMSQEGLGRALDQTTPAARQWERTYGEGGALSGDTNSKSLYDARMGGLDHAGNLAIKRGEQSLSNAFGARGLQNSGAAIRAIGNMNEGVIADRDRQMNALAGQADAAQNTQFGGAFDRLNNFTGHRAKLVNNATSDAVGAFTSGQVGGIQGQLAAAQERNKGNNNIFNQGARIAGYG